MRPRKDCGWGLDTLFYGVRRLVSKTGIESLIERMTTPGVCHAFLMVAASAWIVYRMLLTSLFAPIFDEVWFLSPRYFCNLVCVAACYCELAKIANDSYDRREALALTVLFLMCWGAAERGAYWFVCPVLLVFSARSFDVRKTVGVCTAVVAAVLLFVIGASMVCLVPDTLLYQGARVRHCLGFNYPLWPMQYLFSILCAVCYLRGTKLSYPEGILFLGLLYLLYHVTDGRLSFVLGACLVVGVFIIKALGISTTRFPRLSAALSWSVPFFFVTSVGVTLCYGLLRHFGIGWLDGLNKALGYRLSFGYNGLRNIGFTLLGQRMRWVGDALNIYGQRAYDGDSYNYVDNLFLHILIEQGLLYMVGFVTLNTLVARRALHEGNMVLLLALAVTAAHFTIDDMSAILQCNLLLFLIAELYGPCRPAIPPGRA